MERWRNGKAERRRIVPLPSCPLALLPLCPSAELVNLKSLASHDMITHTKRLR